MSCHLNKKECLKSPECQWIVGEGCKPKDWTPPPISSLCENRKRKQCTFPCIWENRKCRSPREHIQEDKRDCIERSNLPALPHQKKVINWLKEHRGIIAVHNVGSGKTLTAVISSQCFLDENPKRKIIVLTPKSLVPNFKKEMVKYGITDGDDRYLFFSFEKFVRLYNNMEDYKKLCSGNFMIIDEAHTLRTKVKHSELDEIDINEPNDSSSSDSLESKSSRISNKSNKKSKSKSRKSGEDVQKSQEERLSKSTLIVNCAKMVEKILLLTATPFVNESYDVANLIAMVRGENPMTEKEWENFIQNPEANEEYVKNCFSFYESSMEEYPRRVLMDVELEMDKDFYKEYKKI